MDKLRNIGEWAWQNKERLVLGILVAFLAYRIYAVLNPTTIEDQTAQAAAAAPGPGMQTPAGLADDELDDEDDPAARLRRMGAFGGAAETEPVARPVEAPLVFTQHRPPRRIPDPTDLPEEWTEEQGRPPMPPPNPLPPPPVAFQTLVRDNPFSAGASRDVRDPQVERPQIFLLAIQEWGGSGAYRANIQTRTRKWYSEGEQFETYQLISIDPDAGTVDIFSEHDGRTHTYELIR